MRQLLAFVRNCRNQPNPSRRGHTLAKTLGASTMPHACVAPYQNPRIDNWNHRNSHMCARAICRRITATAADAVRYRLMIQSQLTIERVRGQSTGQRKARCGVAKAIRALASSRPKRHCRLVDFRVIIFFVLVFLPSLSLTTSAIGISARKKSER